MGLAITGETRDEIARILEQVAAEGLDHPRNLDSAIDAIGAAFNTAPIQQVTCDDQIFYGGDDLDPVESFGPDITVKKGYFVEVDEE